ncbi:hypothetical protein AC739_06880 [Planococcus glaciei]|uniref:DUF3219 family protein n=1 Tax=Planococcus glaciei TaxID=459472 RepID=UPI00069F5584|nr:DUF3219 family protein [Planococcus glaciei]KOF11105.1 hypothetical protein AC739_06880 [Planococcus glaciei]MBX0315635.1 YkvR family protein [Planococcus glaciei]
MSIQIHINDRVIEAFQFSQETVKKPGTERELHKIIFDFKVTSNEYHDIAVLLYEMDFQIRVPEKNLDFPASISNYSTSITNLYQEGEVADYHLELVEKA